MRGQLQAQEVWWATYPGEPLEKRRNCSSCPKSNPGSSGP